MPVPRLSPPCVLAAALALTCAAGCAWVSGPPLEERAADLAPAHVPGSPLEVQAHNGSVHIRPGSGSAVAIHATLRMETPERLEATTIAADRQADGTLLIRAIPPEGGWRSREGCSFDVTAPDASGATVATDNGRIEVAGVAGRLDLKTSNGAVLVHDAAGPVAAQTSNGRVEVLGARAAVTARSSNGAVVVTLSPILPGR